MGPSTPQMPDGSTARGRQLYLGETSVRTGNKGVFCYTIADQFNTQVAEQSYSQIEGIGGIMRVMDAWNAEFYFQEMVTAHNERISQKLAADGKEPVPLSVTCIPGKCSTDGTMHKCEKCVFRERAGPFRVFESSGSDPSAWA